MYDVTVAVWNRFWSPDLIAGLRRGGLRVQAVVTDPDVPPGTPRRRCWTGHLAMRTLRHVPPRWRERVVGWSITQFEQFAAGHATEARLLWGWSGMSLLGFERAAAAGLRLAVERASTHPRWVDDVLGAEYERRGFRYAGTLHAALAGKQVREMELADFIVVPSEFVAGTCRHHGIPPDKLVINPFGVDCQFWAAPAAARRPPESRPFRIVYAGHIMLRKGVAYLLDAWKQAALEDAELVLAGGPHWTGQALLANLPSRARYAGPLSHTQLRALYREADAYVLPSLEEGLARSVLEAMAAGLPVIVTRETGATDVMVDGEDGWVVPAANSEALAAAFREAARDPGTARVRGQSAARRVAPYSWEAYGDRAAAFARRMLEPRT